MPTSDKPQFPFQLVWIETGEVETYEDEQDLICNLEDFSSYDPSNRAEARITDARGRPIDLVVRIWEDLCEYSLSDAEAPE